MVTVAFTVEIDWAHTGAWTDETSRTRRVWIRTGFDEPLRAVAAVGRCELTMDNGDQRFSPGYTSSPLYGELLPRRQVRVSATSGVTTWVLFRGFVEAIIPDASEAGLDECLITCVDGIALLGQQRIGVAHEDTKAVDVAVDEVVSAAYTPPATSYADNGDLLTHYGRSWQPEETSCLDALRQIAEAVYGRFYIARDGTATYLSRGDRLDSSVNPVTVLADYWRYLVTIRRGHLTGYWRLNEIAGSTAYDSSGNDFDGAVSGVTWNQDGIGDGARAAGFDGVNDFINLYSAGLAAAFDGDAGTVMVWIKADDWADGVTRGIFSVAFNSSNYVQAEKTTSTGLRLRYVAGGTTESITVSDLVDNIWYFVILTWDSVADEVKVYVDGEQVGGTQTGLGTWSGTPGKMLIGAITTTPTSVWAGDIAHVALWDVALTEDEVLTLWGGI